MLSALSQKQNRKNETIVSKYIKEIPNTNCLKTKNQTTTTIRKDL